MDKSNFSAEDFVLDSDFREWILYPNNQRNVRWELYLEKYPDRIKEIQIARELVLNLPKTDHQIKEDEIASLWTKIDAKLVDQVSEDSEKSAIPINSQATIKRYTKESGQRKFNYPLLKIAAIILLAALLGFLYYSLPEREVPQEINWLSYSTKPGVKSSVTLSDGSVVKLNAGSSIRYVQNFVGETREIFLDGEAFFEVAHDTLKPFIVHTQDITTKALGTSFNIKANDSEKIEISLITGKVEVKSQEVQEFIDYLIPGEQVITFAKGNSWEKDVFDEENVIAWMNQTIIFDDTPLPEAIKILENWFGVTITVNQFKDQNLTLSGKFKGETLKNILEGLSYTARFKYEIEGKEIQINFKQ
ncbi:FecR family protein [Algoriphagus aquimarinus]|uniref:FecR family protein n=1 Tax=Algoriphagus aquimarinus TaxID=237018 RepID=UPI0030DAAB56|tara:strand:- start:139567 stop:140649 length:1083 start_codon:yes stop_codon:yes gene_type:complete